MKTAKTIALAAMLGGLPALAPGAEEPATAAEVEQFKQRFESYRQWYAREAEGLKEKIGKAGHEDAARGLADQLRSAGLRYLRFVMILEKDLSLLASPEDRAGEEPPPGLSATDVRRVEKLRQEIREGECERIREALAEGRPLHGDERTEESVNRDEQALDSLFVRKASRLRSVIEKAERAIGKEKDEDRWDDERLDELEKEIEEAEAEVAAIHQYVYGFAPGVGFEEKGGGESEPAAGLLVILREERDRLLKELRGEGEKGGEEAKVAGLIGGSFVYSANLGVVLDVSGSMTDHIESLKKEIAQSFAGPRYREVKGCRITGYPFATELNGPGPADRQETLSVMEELIVIHGVDTLYWFCDLRDKFDYAGLRRLRYLLRRGGAAFHVKSIAERPERELKALITDFQG